jgi:hypothetical protein
VTGMVSHPPVARTRKIPGVKPIAPLLATAP